MPEQLTESQPYKDAESERIKVPDNIRIPETDDALIEVVKCAYQSQRSASQKLPPQYQALENFLLQQYNRCYTANQSVDIEPRSLDFLFQQYAVMMDEKLGRGEFNTFGVAALSYLDGLATVQDEDDRYLGAQENPKDRKQYRAMLLGCSSMSSATEFTAFIHALNPQATAIVADLNPLAVKLAREVAQSVIQADAQLIPLENESIDFIATNFLAANLIDKLGSGEGMIQQLFNQAARVLTPNGRLIMIEQLSRGDLEWLNHCASNADLTLDAGGFLNKAIILPRRDDINRIIEHIPDFIKSDEARKGELMSSRFDIREIPSVTALVFRESQWSQRKGWKRVGRPVLVQDKD